METVTSNMVLSQEWIVGQETTSDNEYPLSIPVEQIIITGKNDRKKFDAQELEELAANIHKNGLGQNPLVRLLADGSYELVLGERRIRAMRDILGWTHILCKVRLNMSDEMASDLMLAENLKRVDLNPIEEAQGYLVRMQEFGYSAADMAKRANVKLYRVTEGLALLTLTADIQHLVSVKQFPRKYALSLADCKLDANRQRIALKAYNTAKYMNEHIWSDLLGQLVEQQAADNQMSMFDLEVQVVSLATELTNKTVKGPQARTGAKAARNLPPVRRAGDDSMAHVFDRYIRDLEAKGLTDAAGAVANIYNSFVSLKWVSVTGNLGLLDTDAGTVGEELNETLITNEDIEPVQPETTPEPTPAPEPEPVPPITKFTVGITVDKPPQLTTRQQYAIGCRLARLENGGRLSFLDSQRVERQQPSIHVWILERARSHIFNRDYAPTLWDKCKHQQHKISQPKIIGKGFTHGLGQQPKPITVVKQVKPGLYVVENETGKRIEMWEHHFVITERMSA